MAEEQLDLFPVTAEILGLALVNFKIKSATREGGEVDVSLSGRINVGDIAQVTHQTWCKAISEWLVTIAGPYESSNYLYEAQAREIERMEELNIQATAMEIAAANKEKKSNVTKFGSAGNMN